MVINTVVVTGFHFWKIGDCQNATWIHHKYGDGSEVCYLRVDSKGDRARLMDAYQAEEFCKTMNAHMVSILSEEELDVVRGNIRANVMQVFLTLLQLLSFRSFLALK